ncbi:MAG: NERD domain-containing protein [Leptospira sp.]|nr:NERD domain-containing protein [Leptospira sp.]
MIYPKHFPGKVRDFSKEREFHKRFSEDFPNDSYVYYSLTLITPDVPMREIDFVIVCPMGILTIELKNGRWRVKKNIWEFYNVRARNWERVEGKSYDSPVSQALSQKDLLYEFLNNHNQLDELVPKEYFHSSVFFLKNLRLEFPIPNVPNLHLFGKKELEDSDNLYELAKQIFYKSSLPPLPNQSLEKIHSIIKKNLNFFHTFRTTPKQDEEDLLTLSKAQFQLVEGIYQKPRNLVFGSSGSGKSILSGELAIQYAKQGKKVILWQGQSSLYCIWKEELKFLKERDNILLIQDLSEIKSDDYEILIADGIESYLNCDIKKYIFPYLAPHFWETKNWVLFIHRRFKYSNKSFLKFLDETTFHIWDIRRNIRNSPEIVNFTNLMLGDFSEYSTLSDENDVQLIKMEEDPTEQIRWCIAYTKKILSIEFDEVVIVTPDLDNKDFLKIKPYLDEHQCKIFKSDDFRGLEESAGILFGFSGWATNEGRERIADTILQFRDLVCLFYTPEEEEVIRNLLKQK